MVHVYHHLTPELIERILGKPDAVTMKVRRDVLLMIKYLTEYPQEELEVAIDQQRDVKERVRALDHLEMVRSSVKYLLPAGVMILG